MVDYILRASLEKHRSVTIVYQAGNKITQRKITVIGFKNNCIEAYCYLRHEMRNFKKENILSASFDTH
jgi:predicted DNA-binding transcriptional regulator YafY